MPVSREDATKKLSWDRTKKGLQLNNNTPYYMTVDHIKYGAYSLSSAHMLAPFSSYTFKEHKGSGAVVNYTLINDFGGFVNYQYSFSKKKIIKK